VSPINPDPNASLYPKEFLDTGPRTDTRADPHAEIFEAAVTFTADTSPIAAHDRFAAFFGGKAGGGEFLFRRDDIVDGCYWVRTPRPWVGQPEGALLAPEPQRSLIQLAPGLMHRFSLPVCAGEEVVSGNGKRVIPFTSHTQMYAWFDAQAARYGFAPLLADVAFSALEFSHAGQRYRIPHALIEGALEVRDPDKLRLRLVHGMGSYRKVGLGMLRLME
jgi:hypothetical protein